MIPSTLYVYEPIDFPSNLWSRDYHSPLPIDGAKSRAEMVSGVPVSFEKLSATLQIQESAQGFTLITTTLHGFDLNYSDNYAYILEPNIEAQSDDVTYPGLSS